MDKSNHRKLLLEAFGGKLPDYYGRLTPLMQQEVTAKTGLFIKDSRMTKKVIEAVKA